MLDEITYAINDTRSQIAKLERHLEILEALPPMPGYVSHIWSNTNEVNIFIPFDLKKLAEVRRLLGPGWRQISVKTYHDGSNRVHCYQHQAGGRLDIVLDPDQVGASCVKVQVGTREEPIFEIRCN